MSLESRVLSLKLGSENPKNFELRTQDFRLKTPDLRLMTPYLNYGKSNESTGKKII